MISNLATHVAVISLLASSSHNDVKVLSHSDVKGFVCSYFIALAIFILLKICCYLYKLVYKKIEEKKYEKLFMERIQKEYLFKLQDANLNKASMDVKDFRKMPWLKG